ncbi:hypothetical protein [Oceanicoccus sagamiensis]|nr:hypothetical protein [Oceanicoccus sagamiensis]
MPIQTGLLAALTLALAWTILQPTFSSFKEYAKAKTLPPMQRLDRLQQVKPRQLNIYSLYDRMAMELLQRDNDSALSTGALIEEAIPNYRALLYRQAVAYAQKGELEKAKLKAREYQQQDMYYMDNNKLLIRIAIKQQEPAFFLEQLIMLWASISIERPQEKLPAYLWQIKNLDSATIQHSAIKRIDQRSALTAMAIMGKASADSSHTQKQRNSRALAAILDIPNNEARYLVDYMAPVAAR